MNPSAARPLRLLAMVQAIALIIGTLIFYTLLSILLSYSILDLISPHSQINGGRQLADTDSSGSAKVTGPKGNAQTPFLGGPSVSHFVGVQIPDSQQPWDPSTRAGSKVLSLLSPKRFPLSSSNSTSKWTGMNPPLVPHWPPAKFIKTRSKNLQSPIPIGQLSGLVQKDHPSSSPENWNPSLNNFKESPLPNIQWPGFADHSKVHSEQGDKNVQRREWVIRAFSHAWEGYKNTAWGYDQANPLSGRGENTFAGWGATILGNLDTLLMMNMTLEYNYARTHVRALDWSSPIGPGTFENLDEQAQYPSINVLESVTRYLGALLSAYDLSGDRLMLLKADELGQWLLPAFNTKTGVPVADYQLGSNPKANSSGISYLSEAGGSLLEFTRLAQVTGKASYFDAVHKASGFLHSRSWNSTSRLGKLLPQTIDPEQPTQLQGLYNLKDKSSVYYEGLVKEQLLLRGNLAEYRECYTSAIDSVFKYLVEDVQLDNAGLVLSIVGEADSNDGKVEYIPSVSQQSCSSAATIGLGARLLNRDDHLNFSLNQTDTCLWVHETSPEGLGPDELIVKNYVANASGASKIPFSEIRDPRFRNRPDTIESVFYMWRLTGNREWQDRGWKLFTKWVEASITENGFAEIKDVTEDLVDDNNKSNRQNGALLAESLKYFFLLFCEPELLSLDQYVFNSAAHPFKIPGANNTRSVYWEDPQDDSVSFLNPPMENIVASQQLKTSQQANISYGTHLQQWSRTFIEDTSTQRVQEAIHRTGT